METLYKIRGKARRDKRKELSGLRSFVRMFWYYEDINRVYGGGMADSICDKIIQDAKEEIRIIEDELKMREFDNIKD